MDDNPVIELVLYRLKEGADEARFLKDADALTDVLRTLPGFVSRRLLTAVEDGQWADLVEWRSMEEALRAAEVFPTLQEVEPLIETVNMTNVTMLHLAPKRSYKQVPSLP
ncbi:MAG: antibiotic biosynthesis monooxygenase family protein [Dehalococcoidia bacterium]